MSEENENPTEPAPSTGQGNSTIVHPVDPPALEDTNTGTPNDDADREANLSMILDIPVNVHVELGQARLSIQDILKLGTGSVVELNRLAGQPADIIANSKLIGQGDVVVVEDNLGIRITKLVGPEQRVKSL